MSIAVSPGQSAIIHLLYFGCQTSILKESGLVAGKGIGGAGVVGLDSHIHPVPHVKVISE